MLEATMSTTYAYNESSTFTVVHAQHIAAKVATDLLRFQRFYGRPPDATIDDYESELVALLKHDYVETVTYGFQRNGRWVEALRYRSIGGGILLTNDDPGKLRPGADIAGAHFTSFLTRTSGWWALSDRERQRFEESLPFQRAGGSEPGIENGYWTQDHTYSAGGRGLGRSTIKRY
jgi:hypothetical protein